jgi:uncharacterized protein YgiB involved in biofilm formation
MPFVIVFIVAVAAFMGWKFLQPECPGGSSVGIEEQCRATFGATFCAQAWPETERIARRSGATYKTQSECLEQWPVCIERSDAAAWAPRPANFCISRASDGSVGRIEPVYSRR